jgi:hypothetical protein
MILYIIISMMSFIAGFYIGSFPRVSKVIEAMRVAWKSTQIKRRD